MLKEKAVHSQLYLSGRLSANPELAQTKKGKLWIRLLLETELVRTSGQGIQSETVVLPISLFSREAEAVKDLRSGDVLMVGCHLYGTKFEGSDGAVKHGCQIVTDEVLRAGTGGAL
jgi:single-stranded DNA-binding protein